MAFLAGPRQVGKTTLGQSLLRDADCESLYFNWDIDAHRRAIVRDPSGFFRAKVHLFELRPYAGKLARTLRREGKVYLFDPTEIEAAGPRFENVVALHLSKLCDFWTDCGLGDFSLHYVRDKEKREVDFAILDRRKPWLLVETKLSDEALSPALRYFHERLKPTQGSIQLVRNATRARSTADAGIHVVPAAWLLANT